MAAREKRFALIAEGITDAAVIENILIGFFQDDEEEPAVNPVQLCDGRPLAPGQAPPGGWTLVLDALRSGSVAKALQTNDYVVIHIDSDVCEEKGFDVPRREGAQPLAPLELAAKVRERLVSIIDTQFCEAH
jgi:hypothetical protein